MKLANWKVLILLFISTLFLYFNIFSFDFVNADDPGQIFDNTLIHKLTLENLKIIFTSEIALMYQPLTSTIFAILNHFFGIESGFSFHLFSFIFHFFNTILVFIIIQKLFKNALTALIISLLFCIHPLNVEVVSWVSATSSVLFAFFFLSSLNCYLNYKLHNRKKWYWFSFMLFLIGCFAKVQIIPLIGVLLLIDYLFLKTPVYFRFVTKQVINKIPFLIIGIVFSIIALSFRNQLGFHKEYEYNPVFISGYQTLWYIFKSLFPFNLGVLYDWPKTLSVIYYISYLFLPVFIFIVYRLRKNKLFVIGVLFYLGNIFLHTALISKLLAPLADRYAYISLIGIWIALFSLLPNIKKNIILVSFLPLLVYFFVLSKNQVITWKNSVTLWTRNLEHEKSTISNLYRAWHYQLSKKDNLAQLDFKKVIANKDNRLPRKTLGDASRWLGIWHAQRGNVDTAEEYFRKATHLDPNNAEAYFCLGVLYKGKNNALAETYLNNAIVLSPNFLDSYLELTKVYLSSKQISKGLNIANKYLTLNSNNYEIHKIIAQLFLINHNKKEALKHLEAAILLHKQKNNNQILDAQLIELQNTITLD